MARGRGRCPTGTALARLAGGLGHFVFVDGGDGSGRNVTTFLLQEEVQFILIIRVQLVALAGVVELAGTEGVEGPSAGRVQRPPAGGQGAQAAPGRHRQGAGGEAGRGKHSCKNRDDVETPAGSFGPRGRKPSGTKEQSQRLG